MKKTFRSMIALILTLAILSPSVFAASSTPLPTEEDTYTITTGSSVSYIDENGNPVVEEEILSSEVVPASALVSSTAVSPRLITKVFSNEKVYGDAIFAVLKAQFTYDSGYSVSCSYKDVSIDYIKPSWSLNGEPTLAVRKGSANQWCRVTATIKAYTENQSPRTYTMWIECTHGGVADMG